MLTVVCDQRDGGRRTCSLHLVDGVHARLGPGHTRALRLFAIGKGDAG